MRTSARDPACSVRSIDSRAGAFTFIEIVAVVVIIGIFFALAIPNLDGLSPKYRLRSATRQLATKIEGHRVLAMVKGTMLGVRYVLDEDRSYYELIRPPPVDYPLQPVEERKSFPPEELPTGVIIRNVQIRGSNEAFDSGEVLVLFSPTGTIGSHSVVLENSRGMTWTMKLNAITGIVDFVSEEDAHFEDFEG